MSIPADIHVSRSTAEMKRKGLGARVFGDTFKRSGARFGAFWLGLLVFTAIFSPLLANSRPLLISIDGRISSPALQYFTAIDNALFILLLVALLLLLWSATVGRKIIVLALVFAVAFFVADQFFQPPKLSVYEEYRDSAGIDPPDWSVYAPIPYSPKDYLRDYGDTGLQPPSLGAERTHLMGTTENGADLFSRMIHASRLALGIGLVATGIAISIGIVVGGLMGYFSGIADMIGMRLVEIFEAVPTLFLLLTFVAFFDRSLYIMMVIIGLTSWPGYARYVRAEFLRLRKQDFVQAAVASGIPLTSVLFRHILPNAVAPVLVAASFGIASAILAEATLSFLGLGLVDDPSWGQMLNQAVRSSTFNWWMALFPGGAIFLTVFSYNLIGESLRDALDPLTQRAESV